MLLLCSQKQVSEGEIIFLVTPYNSKILTLFLCAFTEA